ncbi:MAG: cytochrome c, partial [Devosia sp.]
MRNLVGLMACLVVVSAAAGQSGPEPSLTLTRASAAHRFTAAELLARPDAAELSIPDDISYGGATSYRAVPLLSLLSELPLDTGTDTLEARSTDGFVAQIPLPLVQKAAFGGSIPWIAIEPPGQPWPKLPGKDQGAGPFYLVWQNPERSG